MPILIEQQVVKELSGSRSESGSPAATPAKSVDALDCATRLAEIQTVRDWSKVQQKYRRDCLYYSKVRRGPGARDSVIAQRPTTIVLFADGTASAARK